MNARTRHKATLNVFLAAFLIALFGCESSVDPVLETDRPFSLYGYLNPRADTQGVRIYTIDGVLERTSSDPVDATVVSIDLASGVESTWRDSVIAFDSGMFGHVFYSVWRPVHENRYRLRATRSDGALVQAEVQVPPVATPEVIEPNPDFFELPLPVLWRNAPNLIDITVTYNTTAGVETIKYGVDQEDAANGRVVVVLFRRDTRQLLLNAILGGIREVVLQSIDMRVVVTNEEWTPPGGEFDPDVLVQPGTFSNVENGFGFWGAGYPDSIAWVPPDEVLRNAGFTVN